MASAYPTTLDTLATNKADATVAAGDHAPHHNDLADAINKIEAELGTLPKGSSASVKARLDTLILAAAFPEIPVGVFTSVPVGAISTGTFIGINQPLCYYFTTPTAITVQKLAIEVVTAQASTNVRLGIYNTVGGFPTNLIIDAGQVSSATTGVKEVTFTNTALTPGMYWMAAVWQGGSTSPTMRTQTNVNYHLSGLSSLILPNLYTALASTTAVSGAFPATFPSISTVLTAANTPRIAIYRVS